MIKQVPIGPQDRAEFSKLAVEPASLENDFYDYSKVVVKKPWGYEYLIFCNETIAVWILYLRPGAQTSMHCHPHKKTSLVVLEGTVQCSTLRETFERTSGEGLLIDREVFHQTANLSGGGAFVMEIETPVNKRDLVRLKDRYGREGMGYENEDHHSLNTQNYNYISFAQLDIPHNFKKRFGHCSLTFKKLGSDLSEIQALDEADVLCLLRGGLSSPSHQVRVGDTMTIRALNQLGALEIAPQTELLLIRKIDRILKVSDFVASFLHQQDLTTVFAVPGEANVHLLDSIGRHEGLQLVRAQIERGASLAVEAFAKTRCDLGVLVVSSGGATANALPGVANAWIDSVPMLVLSGQARSDQDSDGHVRQLGNKALNIIDMVKPITKYAVKVTEPQTLRYHLEKAVAFARSGRPGPVWIDLPIDIQGMLVDEEDLKPFDPRELEVSVQSDLQEPLLQLGQMLAAAKRPVLLAGGGIRNAGAQTDLLRLIDHWKIPVLTSRRGADLVADDHPYFFGRPQTYGQRSANFILQNCDLLISIGCRLSIPQIGRNTKTFARAARKVVVDIDPDELRKPTLQPDLAIASDAGRFIRACLEGPSEAVSCTDWLKQCRGWRQRFPPDAYGGPSLPFSEPEERGSIYPLPLMRLLARALGEGDLVIADGGPPLIYLSLAFRFKPGQRLISSTGLELPGFAVAGSIGASIARNRRSVVCVCEDRGFQISVHELQTMLDHRLPIKVLILKSKGHSIIRNIQRDYFGGRFVGTDNEIRLGIAPLAPIARAFGLTVFEASRIEELPTILQDWLKLPGPAVCEVQVEDDQEKIPRPGFTIHDDQRWVAKPLEEMYPPLDRETLRANMLIDLAEED